MFSSFAFATVQINMIQKWQFFSTFHSIPLPTRLLKWQVKTSINDVKVIKYLPLKQFHSFCISLPWGEAEDVRHTDTPSLFTLCHPHISAHAHTHTQQLYALCNMGNSGQSCCSLSCQNYNLYISTFPHMHTVEHTLMKTPQLPYLHTLSFTNTHTHADTKTLLSAEVNCCLSAAEQSQSVCLNGAVALCLN